LQNTRRGRSKLFKSCKKLGRRWWWPSSGGCKISQHACKQWKEEEDREDHETNKKKNMQICSAMKSKDEHHKGEEAWSLRIMKPRRKKTWRICNAKKSRNKHHKGEEA
jgi:hypothetical protein